MDVATGVVVWMACNCVLEFVLELEVDDFLVFGVNLLSSKLAKSPDKMIGVNAMLRAFCCAVAAAAAAGDCCCCCCCCCPSIVVSAVVVVVAAVISSLLLALIFKLFVLVFALVFVFMFVFVFVLDDGNGGNGLDHPKQNDRDSLRR